MRCLSNGCCIEESSDQYSWYIAGSLILISIFLFARDVSREAVATNPYTDVLLASNWQTWKQISLVKREHIFHFRSQIDLISFFVFFSSSRREGRKWIDKQKNKWKKKARQFALIVTWHMTRLPRWSEAIKGSQVRKMYIRACKLSYKSVDSLVQVCNLVCDLLTRSLITQVSRYPIFLKAIVPESLSQWYLERDIGQRTYCFASCYLMLYCLSV